MSMSILPDWTCLYLAPQHTLGRARRLISPSSEQLVEEERKGEGSLRKSSTGSREPRRQIRR